MTVREGPPDAPVRADPQAPKRTRFVVERLVPAMRCTAMAPRAGTVRVTRGRRGEVHAIAMRSPCIDAIADAIADANANANADAITDATADGALDALAARDGRKLGIGVCTPSQCANRDRAAKRRCNAHSMAQPVNVSPAP